MDLEAFILIGGRSMRFGRDKAFVELEGETLADRAARTVSTAFPASEIRFVAAAADQFGSQVERLPRPVVFDRRSGFGAWSAVEAALANAAAEWTLVLACDLPLVTPELLRDLASRSTDGVDAVVPRQADGRLQPLCALYRTSATYRVITEWMDTAERLPPLSTLFERLNHAVVTVEGDALRNVNSPADLNQLKLIKVK